MHVIIGEKTNKIKHIKEISKISYFLKWERNPGGRRQKLFEYDCWFRNVPGLVSWIEICNMHNKMPIWTYNINKKCSF